MSDNDDLAATAFLDTYGDRALPVVKAILRELKRRRAIKRGLPG
jgi:hypothetical protein